MGEQIVKFPYDDLRFKLPVLNEKTCPTLIDQQNDNRVDPRIFFKKLQEKRVIYSSFITKFEAGCNIVW